MSPFVGVLLAWAAVASLALGFAISEVVRANKRLDHLVSELDSINQLFKRRP